MAKMVALITNFLLTILLSGSDGLPGGLHPTPPMGWTSWNTFFENNTEEKMISQVWQLGWDTEDLIPVLISWSWISGRGDVGFALSHDNCWRSGVSGF